MAQNPAFSGLTPFYATLMTIAIHLHMKLAITPTELD